MNASSLNLLAVGDVMLSRLVNEWLISHPPEYPWGNTLKLFESADFRLCNLECVISNQGSPWSETQKVFHFRSDAKNIRVLMAAGIDAVSLANNHTLDFGYDAMFDMLQSLDAAGIAHSGAGRNFEQASQPAIVQIKNRKVGIVSFTDNQPEWEASAQQAGVFYVPVEHQDERTDKLIEVVRTARAESDILIVAAHWGPNWGSTPLLEHVQLAHRFVDAGVDLIVGHSAHICRGIEIYEGRPILYSTGDFIDDYAVDPMERNDQSFLFLFHFEGAEPCQIRLVPTIIREFQARLAEGAEADEINDRMIKLSSSLHTELSYSRDEHCLTGEIIHRDEKSYLHF